MLKNLKNQEKITKHFSRCLMSDSFEEIDYRSDSWGTHTVLTAIIEHGNPLVATLTWRIPVASVVQKIYVIVFFVSIETLRCHCCWAENGWSLAGRMCISQGIFHFVAVLDLLCAFFSIFLRISQSLLEFLVVFDDI